MRPAGAPEAGRRPRRGPVLRLKRGRERARSHPWIFKGDVADVSAVEPGAAVTGVDAAEGLLGLGAHNPPPRLRLPGFDPPGDVPRRALLDPPPRQPAPPRTP